MLRLVRAATALLFFAAVTIAWLPAADAGVPVTGRVLVPGGEPLAEARVELYPLTDLLTRAQAILADIEPEPVTRALTDDHGRFRLEAPHAGLWTVRVEAAGFAPLAAPLVPLIEPIELPDARLATDTRLRVKVRGPDGPVVGALVLVVADRGRFASMFDTGWSTPPRHGRTAEDGSVELARAEGERISLRAVASGFAPGKTSGVTGTAATVKLSAGPAQKLVVRAEDGKPVPGVTVAAGSPPAPLGATGADGSLTIALDPSVLTEVRLLADDGRKLETRLQPQPDDTAGPVKPRELTLPERSIVIGRLIDAESRRAIGGGVVWNPENPLGAVTTERSGGFVLSGSIGERTQMTAGAPGYLQARGREFQFAEDGRPGPVLALHPAAAIEGRVLDADGNPVEGAAITVKEKQTPGMMRIEIGGARMEPHNRSNARGEYRISPLDPDKSWSVKVRAEGFAPGEITVRGLEAHETKRGMDVTLSRGRTVVGRVVDESGSGVRDATVEVEPAAESRGMRGMRIMEGGGGPTPIVGTTDDEGRFEIAGLPGGRVDLEARRNGFARKALKGVELAEAGEPTDVGEIVLSPGERLQGLVTDREGQPLEGVHVYLTEAGGGGMMMSFTPAGSGDQPPDALTDPSGWFTLDDLAADAKYSLRFGRTGYVEKSVSQVKLPHPEPIDVALQPASDVSGLVLDAGGEPIPGARVTMTRSRTVEMGNSMMKMMMAQSDTSDTEGRFLFEDQEPGTISLSAVASGYREAKLDAVEVPAGQDVDDVELPLEGGAVVVGRVLTPDGRPAVEAAVQPAGEGRGIMRLNAAAADGDGNYRLEGLAPGPTSIEATHDDYPRVVRDIELKEGINSLDLDFEGGVEVAGRVVDTTGKPVPNAAVRLMPAGRFFGGPETESGQDGRFSMPGVQDGDYRLWAQAEGYAASDGKQSVNVAGQPVQEVEIVLDAGSTLVGRVLGLEPERFGDVGVRARGESFGGFDDVGVDFEGNFRIDHVKPGTYDVVAELADSGRRATERVQVEAGSAETRVDLRFEGGLTLSGKAVQGGQPVIGANLYAEGLDVEHLGWGETDRDGGFSIEGLQAGRYRVNLRDWSTGLAYSEEHDIGSSREITLRVPTARVAGSVVDSADRQPLQGVTLTLRSEATSGQGRMPTHTATTDLEGKFEFSSVGDGEWKLSAARKGYSALSRPLSVQLDRSIDDLRLSMDPTEGLTLEARLATGAAPDEVRVAVLDPAGGALVSGNYSTGEQGRVRLSSVPPGSWTLVVSATGSATQMVEAQAPGATVPVSLQPACILSVVVPDLDGSSALATVTLTDSGGRRFHALSWSGQPRSEWRMSGGRMEFGSLPPGSWTVSVAGPDGRSWQSAATTTAGTPAEVRLE
jgi:uncharacterized GH25 family protein